MDNQQTASSRSNDLILFWGCFLALMAAGVGFVVRAQIIGEWGSEFNLSSTQKGEIFGVGLWPAAISMVLFSLVVDRVGYKNAMIFGFVCHMVGAIMTIFAKDYTTLYVATFCMALAQGTVEAYINPAVASLFKTEKTKWLTILHASWPVGMVFGGVLVIGLDGIFAGDQTAESMSWLWQLKVALIFIPAVAYFVMLIRSKFPVDERVEAGVPYQEMLKEFGIIGALIVIALISAELGTHLGLSSTIIIGTVVVLTAVYAYFARSLGNPIFLILVIVMIPLATTELGTDSWITSLMEPEFAKLGMDSLWLLIYTSAIMAVLRFFAGPLVHRLSPLGLLAISALVAAGGLIFLSKATGAVILAAATLYGVGKTFFWPTMLGVVAERFPKGGALTLNGISAIGLLGVGIVGSVFLGNIQDNATYNGAEAYDAANGTAIQETYMGLEKRGIFGKYQALDQDKYSQAPEADKATIDNIQAESNKSALATVALFPVFMLVVYIGLILYFRSRGGYKPILLDENGNEVEVEKQH
ncbi:MAG: MFS transporter [Bacteroidota bacterium]